MKDVGAAIRAEGEREVARRCWEGMEPMNSYDAERWAATYDRSLQAQSIRLSAALRALGWSFVASIPIPLFRSAAEDRAEATR